MKRCKACGGPYRTGTIAHVAGERHKLEAGRVCPKCAALGVLVVPVSAAVPCKCGARATRCSACASTDANRDRAKVLASALAPLRAMRVSRAMVAKEADGIELAAARAAVDVLDDVLALLEGGRF